MFCAIALFTNMVIICNLILAGKVAIEVLTKNSSSEFIVMILAVLFGSYCLIGGLGTTFYISYFNTCLIFISTSMFILKITYLAEPDVKEVASPYSLYEAMACLKGPEGNYDNSFLTFRTKSGIIYGIVMLFMTIAIVFCDQANWQSRIAAKPKEGILGFFIAGFLWFAIPTSMSFVTSMTYKSMSFRNGTNLLTDDEIDQGRQTIPLRTLSPSLGEVFTFPRPLEINCCVALFPKVKILISHVPYSPKLIPHVPLHFRPFFHKTLYPKT